MDNYTDNRSVPITRRHGVRTLVCIAWLGMAAVARAESIPEDATKLEDLAGKLQVGDVVFIRVAALPFRKVAGMTGSWTNHVGIVIDTSGREPRIAESTFPLSRITTLSRFVARSEARRVAVTRLNAPLSDAQRADIARAARKRLHVLYDTGFDLHSRRQFCSRYVREVLHEATGIEAGDVENFATLLSKNPDADLHFWRLWYFNRIPWQRETVSPASLLASGDFTIIFDGQVTSARPHHAATRAADSARLTHDSEQQ
jgi:hypothetical protein